MPKPLAQRRVSFARLFCPRQYASIPRFIEALEQQNERLEQARFDASVAFTIPSSDGCAALAALLAARLHAGQLRGYGAASHRHAPNPYHWVIMQSSPTENEADIAYNASLQPLGLAPGGGISMTCPSCCKRCWMRLPVSALGWFRSGVHVSCPTACGHFGELKTFAPTPEDTCPDTMDTRGECRSCGVEFAADGVVLRRPCCAIETPREVMRETIAYIEARINALPPGQTARRRELELLLGLVISTFDGLMRGMLAIANENRRRLSLSDPTFSGLDGLPASMSFQSLERARKKLLPLGWDMQTNADWDALIRLFQKRHAISHQLGVADQEYLTKTGDGTAELGKRVPLTAEEIVNGSKECQKLINAFFGMFLS